MVIIFKTKKLKRICNCQRLLQKEYGADQARKIRLRLDELHAAENLDDISYLPPPRLHQLTGDRRGIFSVDLKQPFRMLFEPIDQYDDSDESVNLGTITAIRILRIEDPHGKSSSAG